MSLIPILVLLTVVAAIGLFATIQVARSPENRDGNPRYDRQTGANWVRLTVLYVLGGIAGIAVLLVVYYNL